jgi:hypothetical protein
MEEIFKIVKSQIIKLEELQKKYEDGSTEMDIEMFIKISCQINELSKVGLEIKKTTVTN